MENEKRLCIPSRSLYLTPPMENVIMIRINQKGIIMKYRVTFTYDETVEADDPKEALLEVCLNIDEQRISDNATVEPVV